MVSPDALLARAGEMKMRS
jgi:hypothetical protein